MANDPGWGNRNNNEGPPDLDELLRQFNKKINGMFKNNGNEPSEQPSSPREPVAISIPLWPVIAAIGLIWLATGFYIVDQGSEGVVQRFGKYLETTNAGPHWHLPYPFERVSVVNTQQVNNIELGFRTSDTNGDKQKVPQEALMLTDDENIIDVQFAVQYNIKSAEDYVFNNRETDKAVRSAAESAIREVVGKNKLDYVLQAGREDVATKTKLLMQQILDRYKTGVNIVTVTMQGATPPDQVKEAFDDVNRANQDMQRQINEGEAYANDILPKARGAAARLLAEASGYQQRVIDEAKGNTMRFEQILTEYEKAPQVTRDRIYLETQEKVLSNSSKILIDQKGGNNLLYLPLDKLMTRPDTGAAADTAAEAAPKQYAPNTYSGNVPSQVENTNLVTEDYRSSKSLSSRNRESR